MDALWLIAFFEHCQTANKAVGVLDKLKERSSQKKRRWLIFLSLAAMIWTTGSIVARTATTINATNTIAKNNNMTVAIKTINATITLVAKRRATRKRPTRRKMSANVITSRRMTRSCTTTNPLCRVWTFHPEKEVTPIQGLLLAHDPGLAQAAVTGAMQIIIFLIMTASQVGPSSMSICTLKTITADKSTVPPSQQKWYCFCHLCRSKSKEEQACSQIGNRTSRITSLCPTLYILSR